MKRIILIVMTLLQIILSAKSPETQHLFLRHEIFSSLSDYATPSNAVTTLQTCKDLGSTWNSLTGTVDSVKGTWQGT